MFLLKKYFFLFLFEIIGNITDKIVYLFIYKVLVATSKYKDFNSSPYFLSKLNLTFNIFYKLNKDVRLEFYLNQNET